MPLLVRRRKGTLRVKEALHVLSRGRRDSGTESVLDVQSDHLIDVSDSLLYMALGRGRFLVVVALFPEDHPDPFQLLEIDSTDDMITALRWFDDRRLIVGFRSGCVRIFDAKTLRMVYRRTFHPTPILRIKRTQRTIVSRPASGGLAETPFLETWYLHKGGTVVAHSTEALRRALQTKKSDVTIKHAVWSLRSQKTVNDFCVRVPNRPTLFEAKAATNVANIIAAGSEDALATYVCRREGVGGGGAGIMRGLATAVAGKLSSTLLKWGFAGAEDLSKVVAKFDELGGGDDAKSKDVKLQTPTRLRRCRYVRDTARRVESISMDPSGTLCVTTDNLGRVMLIDAETMQILRVWKGYRNAQCGWTVHSNGRDRRTNGLYIAMYTANRRVLELWRARNGPRVDAITVPGGCRLFTIPCPVLEGVDDASSAQTYRARCILLRPSSLERSTATKSSANDDWELLEVMLSKEAEAVVLSHRDSIIDQRQNRMLDRMMLAVSNRDRTKKESRVDDAETPPWTEHVLSCAQKLSNPALLERAASSLEKLDRDALICCDVYRRVMKVFMRALDDAAEGTSASRVRKSFEWRLDLFVLWSSLLSSEDTDKPEDGDESNASDHTPSLDEALLWLEAVRSRERACRKSVDHQRTKEISFHAFRRDVECVREGWCRDRDVKDTTIKYDNDDDVGKTTGATLFESLHTSSASSIDRRSFDALKAMGLPRKVVALLFSRWLCTSTSCAQFDRTRLRATASWLRQFAFVDIDDSGSGAEVGSAVEISGCMRRVCDGARGAKSYYPALVHASLCVAALEHCGDMARSKLVEAELQEWRRVRRDARTALFVSLSLGGETTTISLRVDAFCPERPSALRSLVATTQLDLMRESGTGVITKAQQLKTFYDLHEKRRYRTDAEGEGVANENKLTPRAQSAALVAIALRSKRTMVDILGNLGRARALALDAAPALATALCPESLAMHRIEILRSRWQQMNSTDSVAVSSFAELNVLENAIVEIEVLATRSPCAAASALALWNTSLRSPIERMLLRSQRRDSKTVETSSPVSKARADDRPSRTKTSSPAGKAMSNAHHLLFLRLSQRVLRVLRLCIKEVSRNTDAPPACTSGDLCVMQWRAFADEFASSSSSCSSNRFDVVDDFVAMRLTELLYESCQDGDAELQMRRIDDIESKLELAKTLIPMAHQRLANIFHMCESSPKHAPVLACVDAGIYERIVKGFRTKDLSPAYTLAMTESMLRNIESLVSNARGSFRADRADALTWVVDMRKGASEALAAARERRLILDSGSRRIRGLRRARTRTSFSSLASSSPSAGCEADSSAVDEHDAAVVEDEGGEGDWV